MLEIAFDYSPEPLKGWESKQIEAMRAKAQKMYLAALKPECSRCRKPGSDCRNREKCNQRRLKLALKGCDAVRLHGTALPKPPESWIVARGYGVIDGNYRTSYGMTTSNRGYPRLRLTRCFTAQDRVAMNQHYAYDLAMGVSWSETGDDDQALAA